MFQENHQPDDIYIYIYIYINPIKPSFSLWFSRPDSLARADRPISFVSGERILVAELVPDRILRSEPERNRNFLGPQWGEDRINRHDRINSEKTSNFVGFIDVRYLLMISSIHIYIYNYICIYIYISHTCIILSNPTSFNSFNCSLSSSETFFLGILHPIISKSILLLSCEGKISLGGYSPFNYEWF